MQIVCYTVFDITRTRVIGHFNQSTMPFYDHTGQLITTSEQWVQSRNQQRNWETLTQVLSLRTQLLNITDPVITTHDRWPGQAVWSFVFDIEFDDVLSTNNNLFGLLLQDINQVPMLVHLTETVSTQPLLIPAGPQTNIVFAENW